MKNSILLVACVVFAGGLAFSPYAYAGDVEAAPHAVAQAPAMPTAGMTKSFHARLSGKAEVPPVSGTGRGRATFKLDTATKTLTWHVSYKDLTGPAVAAHIHGPAAAGANAGVEVPFSNVGTSPFTGSATLTDAQIADLMSGKTYVNIHTAANKGGEIRGQIVPSK